MALEIGSKVKVCDELETTIEDIKFRDGVMIYYFRDEKGKLWGETETAIELID